MMELKREDIKSLTAIFPGNCAVYKLKDRMDAGYREMRTAEHSILQYFNGIEARGEGPVFEEYSAAKARAEESKSAWNLDELLEIAGRLIEQDQETLKQEQEKLGTAEKELKSTERQLNLAQINNECIRKRDRLQAEKEALDARKPEIEAAKTLLNRQKCAVRIVYPFYFSWKKKEGERKVTEEQIRKREEDLKAAEEAARNADALLKEAEGKRPEAERLTEKEILRNIRRIDRNRRHTREVLTGKSLGDGSTFDLTVNASHWEIKKLAEAVAEFSGRWFEQYE